MRAENSVVTTKLNFWQRTVVEKRGSSFCIQSNVRKTMYMKVGTVTFVGVLTSQPPQIRDTLEGVRENSDVLVSRGILTFGRYSLKYIIPLGVPPERFHVHMGCHLSCDTYIASRT